MLESDLKMPLPPVDLQQAVTDIIESISMEDTALGKILASESEALEKAKSSSGDMQEFVYVNESVSSLVRYISRLQLLIQYELEDAKKLLEKSDDLADYEE